MLRALLLYLSKAPWARRMVTRWKVARRVASRFVAGDLLDQALSAVQALNARGLYATLDHLGENVTNADEARRAVEDYLVLMDRICQAGIQSNASLKLTQLGLGVDFDLCLDNMRRLLHKAAECGLFVRIDMEDSPAVDRTLRIYHTLKAEGLVNTGVVIQAYLYRSEQDVKDLLAEGARIRLCKGAYKEPPEVAYPRKADVNANYDRLAALMIDAALATGGAAGSEDGHYPPRTAVATHDSRRIQFAKDYAARVGLPQHALEFQMLYGIRSDLQLSLAREGYPVRVYVPYGTEWYPYTMRRLAERPANVWFFVSNFFRG
ncbi:MAG: proline dehydrogenase family protein [Chloroflexota bacterium]